MEVTEQAATTHVLKLGIGLYRGGTWSLIKGPVTAGNSLKADIVFAYGGVPGDIPIRGDWGGVGADGIGIYRKGLWILDQNNNHALDPRDNIFPFGGVAGDVPVTGDWGGTGKVSIGIYRAGLWVLDTNNNHVIDPKSGDLQFAFGGLADDIPVVGQWNGGKKTTVGIYRNGGYWILDANGNGKIDPDAGDAYFKFGGQAGDIPVTGDWNGDGKTKVGIYRNGLWILDYDGTHRLDPATNASFSYGGSPSDMPIVGKW